MLHLLYFKEVCTCRVFRGYLFSSTDPFDVCNQYSGNHSYYNSSKYLSSILTCSLLQIVRTVVVIAVVAAYLTVNNTVTIFLVYRWGNWGIEYSSLPKDIRPVSGRTGTNRRMKTLLSIIKSLTWSDETKQNYSYFDIKNVKFSRQSSFSAAKNVVSLSVSFFKKFL